MGACSSGIRININAGMYHGPRPAASTRQRLSALGDPYGAMEHICSRLFAGYPNSGCEYESNIAGWFQVVPVSIESLCLGVDYPSLPLCS